MCSSSCPRPALLPRWLHGVLVGALLANLLAPTGAAAATRRIRYKTARNAGELIASHGQRRPLAALRRRWLWPVVGLSALAVAVLGTQSPRRPQYLSRQPDGTPAPATLTLPPGDGVAPSFPPPAPPATVPVLPALPQTTVPAAPVPGPVTTAPAAEVAQARPQRLAGAPPPPARHFRLASQLPAFVDDQLWKADGTPGDRDRLIEAIDHSLRYVKSNAARKHYARNFDAPETVRTRVRRGLERFRSLVKSSRNAGELQAAVEKEFAFYEPVNDEGSSAVLFTGYYEPILEGSSVRTREFRYPLYAPPANLAAARSLERKELEGVDGLTPHRLLRGRELFYFRNRLDPIIAQIQGSAKVRLRDGSLVGVHYHSNTRFKWKALGKILIEAGKLPPTGVRMPHIQEYFAKHPGDLDRYVPQDPSFVFFTRTGVEPAKGSIGVPVVADRSIATDMSLTPPGGLAVLRGTFPFVENGKTVYRPVLRYVLNHDTGGAIVGPTRVDWFVGTGAVAGIRSGVTALDGSLYYLLPR
jgi:membrane-bound lytic murein transglycosylase A